MSCHVMSCNVMSCNVMCGCMCIHIYLYTHVYVRIISTYYIVYVYVTCILYACRMYIYIYGYIDAICIQLCLVTSVTFLFWAVPCAVARAFSGAFCVVCYFLCGLRKLFWRVDLSKAFFLHTYIHTYITLHYITLHYITLH